MENKKKGFRGSGNLSPSEGFFENMYFKEKFYNRILKRAEWFKCATVLGLKNFTWFKELELDFGVHPSIANQFILECKQHGLVVSKLLSELDNLYYEAILRTKTVAFYNQVNNINILTLTPDGIEFFKCFLEENKEYIENNNHLKFNYDEVNNKIKYLLVCLNKIKEEESILLPRKVKYPRIGVIERDSEALRQRKIDIEKANLEFRQELLQKKKQEELTYKDKQYLVKVKDNNSLVIAENKINKKYKSKTEYEGIHSHLNSQEIEKIRLGVNKEEQKQVEKEYKNEIEEKINKLNNYQKYIGKGYHNEKDKPKDEALAFLDSL